MITDTLKKILSSACDALGVQADEIHLEHPVDPSRGDYSTNLAMLLGRAAALPPRELAEKIVAHISGSFPPDIERAEVAGPGFINFFLSSEYFTRAVAEILADGSEYGKNKQSTGGKWLIEHTSPNPNKAMHIGHLRNNLYGMAVANLADASGREVIRDAVDNNHGISIARLMWGYLKFARKNGEKTADIAYWHTHQDEWQTPEAAGVRPDRFVDELYVRGAGDCKENSDSERRVRELVVLWERGDEVVRALWQRVLTYSYDGQRMTLERLGNRWDYVWHEDEHYELGKQMVADGLAKGVFRRLEDGAILTNLAAYHLPDTIIKKSDGTALYITQDIALTKLKREKFHADRMFWVIGSEQSLAMKQLFAVCEQLGIGKAGDYTHLPYGYVSIKGVGKMSSRAGNVVYIDEVLDEVKEKVRGRMKPGGASADADAEVVALGAVKYEILRVSPAQDISFDLARATNFEGDSGPYLQYAAVRARSVLEKASTAGLRPSVEPAAHSDGSSLARAVERLLPRFPEVARRAADEFAPQLVATYLIELARAFNSFYASETIADADDPRSPYKLALALAVATVIENGLSLLGVQVPEKM